MRLGRQKRDLYGILAKLSMSVSKGIDSAGEYTCEGCCLLFYT